MTSPLPKLLVVDDAKAVRTLVRTALSPFACDVADANNGYTALVAMERSLPDLILLDVSMPVMGGVEMLTLMRSHPQLRTIPVIMLTSPTDHPVLPEIDALGVSARIVKPFNAATVVATVQAVLPLNPATPRS